MTRDTFGAKPTVLRCSRCGKFVDWEHARLKVICGCRPHLDLPPVLVRPAEPGDRRIVDELFVRDFGHVTIIAFDDVIDVSGLPALVAEMRSDIAGALVYRPLEDALHIVALATDPMWQRSGVAGHLVAEAELLARSQGFRRIVTATTNDNLPALYFYQRHGMRLLSVVRDAFAPHGSENSTGFAGITIRDEVRMEKPLT